MDNRQIVTDWIERVWNRGDLDCVDEHMAPDCEVRGTHPGRVSPAEYKAYVRSMQSTLHGLRVEIESVVAQGDEVVVFSRMQGRHATTGESVNVWVATQSTLHNGKIVKVLRVWDAIGYLVTSGRVGREVMADLLLS